MNNLVWLFQQGRVESRVLVQRQHELHSCCTQHVATLKFTSRFFFQLYTAVCVQHNTQFMLRLIALYAALCCFFCRLAPCRPCPLGIYRLGFTAPLWACIRTMFCLESGERLVLGTAACACTVYAFVVQCTTAAHKSVCVFAVASTSVCGAYIAPHLLLYV